MFNELEKVFELQEVNVAEYSPLTLAFMGDCVYELIIRTRIVYSGNTHVSVLSKKSSALAKAQTQAKIIEGLFDSLSEEEQAAYKRGRNANTHSKAKNATLGEYRKATGFESLLGYLYLKKDFDRIMEIVKKGFEIIEGEKV